jgi:hypothetical protein
MPTTAIQLAVFVIEEAIKNAPELLLDMKNLFGAGVPTAEDFAALRQKIAGESYKTFVPQSRLTE